MKSAILILPACVLSCDKRKLRLSLNLRHTMSYAMYRSRCFRGKSVIRTQHALRFTGTVFGIDKILVMSLKYSIVYLINEMNGIFAVHFKWIINRNDLATLLKQLNVEIWIRRDKSNREIGNRLFVRRLFSYIARIFNFPYPSLSL